MRVAVVTGASSGIGAELVRTLRLQGWRTVGISRRESSADEHEECDVADRVAVEALAARVLERHERIDLLVNNAGFTAGTDFVGGDPAQIEAMIRTNYLGSVWIANAFLPGLGRGSHIVNIVSIAGEVAVGPYSASKHAQLAFSRSLSVELAPRGIGVHTVKPGSSKHPASHTVGAAGSQGGWRSTLRSSPNGSSERSSTTGARSRCRAGTGRSP